MLKVLKLLFCVSMVMALLFVCTLFASAEGNRVGTVTGNGLNVRETPGTSAKIVSQLSKGTKVNVLEDSNGWFKVKFNSISGWVHGDYLDVQEVAIATGVIGGSDVNVRKKPDLTAEIAARLDKGDKLDIFERSDKWYRVKLADGSFGWVHVDYVSLDANSSRGVVDDAAPKIETPAGDAKKDTGDESQLADKIESYAKKFLGVKYVYGGSSPKGFDCSGFVSYVFKHFGVDLERTAAGQAQHGQKVSKDKLKKGDLVFFDTNGGLNGISHVGIYLGGGKFIHASSGRTTKKVVISDLTGGFYAKSYMRARRYIK